MICFVCVLLVVSAAAVCGCLGQQDFVGFAPSLAGAPAHVKPKAIDAAVNLLGGGKILLRWSEDSAES